MSQNALMLNLQQSRLVRIQLAKEAQWKKKEYERNQLFNSRLFQISESPSIELFRQIFEAKRSELREKEEPGEGMSRDAESSNLKMQAKDPEEINLIQEINRLWSSLSNFARNEVYRRIGRGYQMKVNNTKQLAVNDMNLATLKTTQKLLLAEKDKDSLNKLHNDDDLGEEKDDEQFEVEKQS